MTKSSPRPSSLGFPSSRPRTPRPGGPRRGRLWVPLILTLIVGVFAGMGDARAAGDAGPEVRLEDSPGTSARCTSDAPVRRIQRPFPLGHGRWLSITETFSPRCRRPGERRAVLFLSGSAFKGNHWTVPYPGYDAPALAARRGFYAYTVDYLGVGESFRPADGRDASFEAQVEAVGRLVDWIRRARRVPGVDLVGAGFGGGVAAVLAQDPQRVRSVTMSAQIYRQLTGGPLTDPDFIAALESSPDGYFFVPGEAGAQFFNGTPEPVQDYLIATQGGTYPVDNFLVATDLPFFDATAGRAPLLVLYGQQDGIALQSDIEDLVAEWGAEALLAVNPEAAHAPRLESPEIAAWFWQEVFAFIDP